MKCSILHESNGRMRVHIERGKMTLRQADILEYYLRSKPFVRDVKVYDRTGDAVIFYREGRGEVISALARFTYDDENMTALVPEHTGRELDRRFEDRLIFMLAKKAFSMLFLPNKIRFAIAVIKSLKYVAEALKCIAKREVRVEILDATAIVVSLLRGDRKTAASVMFLLSLGEMLEDWTHKRSVDDLARTMSLGVDKVWLIKDGTEALVPIKIGRAHV